MANSEYEKVVRAAGSEAALARLLGTAQQHLNRLSKRPEFTADWALRIRNAARQVDAELNVDVGALCSDLKGWTPPSDGRASAELAPRKRGRPPGTTAHPAH